MKTSIENTDEIEIEYSKTRCIHCEKEFDDSDIHIIDDECYCNDCFDELFFYCEDCNTFYEKSKHEEYYVEKSDKTICDKCYENYYTSCDDCNEIIPLDNAIYIDADDKYICEDCFESDYVVCYHCSNTMNTSDATYVDSVGDYVCDDCLRDNYFQCEECGGWIDVEEHVCYRNMDICESCYNERLHNIGIREYSYNPREFHFYNEEGENEDRTKNPHVGIELEIQGEYRDDFCEGIHENYSENMFYMKSDGSLDMEYGVEVISHPMTKKYILNDNWRNIFERMENNYMDDTDNCGLHFHIDRNYLTESSIVTMDYIVNNFSEYFSIIGGRNFTECSEYCKKVQKNTEDWGHCRINQSRYQAVNLNNSDTVELRFCKGVSAYSDFVIQVKMIFAIIKFSMEHSFDSIKDWSKNKFIEEFEKLDSDVKEFYYKFC